MEKIHENIERDSKEIKRSSKEIKMTRKNLERRIATIENSVVKKDESYMLSVHCEGSVFCFLIRKYFISRNE